MNREYKLAAKPMDITDLANSIGGVTLYRDVKLLHDRRIWYYDSTSDEMRKSNLILRKRDDDFVIKYRHVDRHFVKYYEMSNTIKTEEDIKPPFQSIYSKSAKYHKDRLPDHYCSLTREPIMETVYEVGYFTWGRTKVVIVEWWYKSYIRYLEVSFRTVPKYCSPAFQQFKHMQNMGWYDANKTTKTDFVYRTLRDLG